MLNIISTILDVLSIATNIGVRDLAVYYLIVNNQPNLLVECQTGCLCVYLHRANVSNRLIPLYSCDNTNIIYYSLTSILLSHFILDLRSFPLSEDDTSGSKHQVTSVRFATNIGENLGGSLDISWATGEERDIDSEEDNDIAYSDNPLAVGLIDIRRDDEERLEAAETS